MSAQFDRADNDALTGPLSSIEISAGPSAATGTQIKSPQARPLALRDLQRAPERQFPEYVYDPVRQIATDRRGRPLVPDLKKDWTTIEGTHTDGDGGDNEMWEWEETS